MNQELEPALIKRCSKCIEIDILMMAHMKGLEDKKSHIKKKQVRGGSRLGSD